MVQLRKAMALALALTVSSAAPAGAYRTYCEFPFTPTSSSPQVPLLGIDAYIEQNKERWISEDLEPFLRMNCTSAKEGEDLAKKTECAAYLEQMLEKKGFEPKVFVGTSVLEKKVLHHPVETGLLDIRPVVYAQLIVDPSLPTILFDTHYDGRPANDNPKDKWKTNPFEAVRKSVVEDWHTGKINDQRIYARRAVDSVGHILSIIWALEAYRAVHTTLPVNVKMMFEGAEEIGSPGMEQFIAKYRDMLQADLAVIADLWTNRPGIPIIEGYLRGGIKGELCVETAVKEGHSGGGSYLPNASGMLASIMTRIVDPITKKVNLPVYQRSFQRPSTADIRSVEQLYPHWNAAERAQTFGAKALVGNPHLHPAVQTILYPSWDWEMFDSGESGREGVIPSHACVGFLVRLGTGQDYQAIFNDLENMLKNQKAFPEGRFATLSAKLFTGFPAFHANLDNNKYTPKIKEALQSAFGTKEFEMDLNGAGEPIASYLHNKLQIPVFLTGYGHPNDNPHATNEGILVEYGLLVGVRATIYMMENIHNMK